MPWPFGCSACGSKTLMFDSLLGVAGQWMAVNEAIQAAKLPLTCKLGLPTNRSPSRGTLYSFARAKRTFKNSAKSCQQLRGDHYKPLEPKGCWTLPSTLRPRQPAAPFHHAVRNQVFRTLYKGPGASSPRGSSR